MNTIIPISKYPNGAGYVYLAKFNLFKESYKIGSTCNLIKRKQTLESLFGSTHLVAYGFTNERLEKERIIQAIFRDYSNQRIVAERASNGDSLKIPEVYREFIGGVISKEHFIFKEGDIPKVISTFNTFCTSVKCPDRWGAII